MAGRARPGKVIAAMLMREYGVLSDRQWDCKRCIALDEQSRQLGTPSLRESRGCGSPPSVNGKAWDPEAFLLEHGIDEAPRAPYRFGNLGDVGRVNGWLWPWCPKWFLAFAPTEDIELAREGLEMNDWLELGALAQFQGGTLTAGATELILTAKRMRNSLVRAQVEREQRAAEQKAKARRG